MGICFSNEQERSVDAEAAAAGNNGNTTNNKKSRRIERRKRQREQIQSLLRVDSLYPRAAHGSPGGLNHHHRGISGVKASNYNHVHELVAACVDERATDTEGGRHTPGVTGFRNLGNTCFMNSSIQCLSATIPLTDYFLGYDYRKEINHDNFLGTGGALATSYAELMKMVWLGHDQTLSLSSFKSNLERFAPQFAGGAQHDTQEFLSFLLDGIHEDLNRVYDKPYIEDLEGDGTTDDAMVAMKSWQNYLRRNKSVVVDLFQGQLRNMLVCRNTKLRGRKGCGHKSVKFEPFMYLSVPILSDSTVTLDDCLQLFCREEVLEGDNQWYCEKCRCHVDATKKFDLWALPPILIIHLKRFKHNDWGVRSKIDDVINYPVTGWDLTPLMKSGGIGDKPLYDLFAVANHYGDLGGGHYTAHAMNRVDDEWYDFNDARVSRIDPESLGNNNSAYVLFYNRTVDPNVSAAGGGSADAAVENKKNGNHRRAGRPLKPRVPLIHRQSVARPEHWPHMKTPDGLKDFRRTPSRRGEDLMQQQQHHQQGTATAAATSAATVGENGNIKDHHASSSELTTESDKFKPTLAKIESMTYDDDNQS